MASEASALLAPQGKAVATKPHSTSTIHLDSSSSTRTIIDQDKKKLSVLPLLVWIHISFVTYVIGRSYSDNIITRNDLGVLLVAPAILLLYSLWFMHVGSTKQLFVSLCVLSSFPMVFLPLVPVTIIMSVFALRWSAVMAMMEHVNVSYMIAVQATRSLAVGTLLKWHRGVFPTGFAWGTGFPDMLFGLSAVALLVGCQETIMPGFLMWWNILGFVIIVPFGVTIVQLGMTPTQLYKSHIPLSVVFEYPMVLGPGIVVPILLCWNVLMALST